MTNAGNVRTRPAWLHFRLVRIVHEFERVGDAFGLHFQSMIPKILKRLLRFGECTRSTARTLRMKRKIGKPRRFRDGSNVMRQSDVLSFYGKVGQTV